MAPLRCSRTFLFMAAKEPPWKCADFRKHRSRKPSPPRASPARVSDGKIFRNSEFFTMKLGRFPWPAEKELFGRLRRKSRGHTATLSGKARLSSANWKSEPN